MTRTATDYGRRPTRCFELVFFVFEFRSRCIRRQKVREEREKVKEGQEDEEA